MPIPPPARPLALPSPPANCARRRPLPWLLLLVGLWIAATAPPAQASALLELAQAEVVLDEARHPPGADAPWQPQALPDHWRESRPAAGGIGWYRFRFTPTIGSQTLLAVYLPRLGLNAEVWLNGVQIGSGGRFDEPIARNWNRPMIFVLPPGHLRPGENLLHVRLRGHPYTQAYLDPIFVGPEADLRPMFERNLFLRVSLNQTATLLIGAVGLLAVSLWWRRRRETAYGYFAASALVWAGQSTNLYLRNPIFPTAFWEVVVNASFQLFAMLLLLSLLHFLGIRRKPVEQGFIAAMPLAALSLALVPAARFFEVTAFWHLVTLAATLLTLALITRAALGGDRDARVLVGAVALIALFGGHDWLVHSHHLFDARPGGFAYDLYLLQYGAPLLFLAVGWLMTSRYARVLDEFEGLNRDLEERVQAKHAQLQESFTRMRLLEMEQAVAGERERIYRDLHDDVGAKLLSLVYRAERPENADLARSALQDLRDMVSRAGSGPLGLDDAAADWRAECEQRLGEAGIRLEWSQEGELERTVLSQPQVVHLGRILREAVSNAIRHSGARRVHVGLLVEGGRMIVVVQDDGCGCPDAPESMGRGLRNMEARAARMGGVLRRGRGGEGGCLIRVEVPGPDLPGDLSTSTSGGLDV